MEIASRPTPHEQIVSSGLKSARIGPPQWEPNRAVADAHAEVHALARAVYLIAFAYLRDSQRAEWITFRAFVKSAESKQKARSHEDLKELLIAVAISEIHDHLRVTGGSTNELDPTVGQIPFEAITEWQPIPVELLRNPGPRKVVMDALLSLPMSVRLTLLLRDVLHFATLATARLLGVSEQLVRENLSHGRLAMCAHLNRDLQRCPQGAQATLASAS